MDSVTDPWFFITGVSPFGHPRVKAYFQLTAAFRRLSRPSSALGAKAFTLCSFSLEQLRLLRSLFPLGILNSSSSLLAWASQIIVCLFGLCWKDRFFRNFIFLHCVSTTRQSLVGQRSCSVFPLFGKTFDISLIFLYTTICSFLSSIRFSMNICLHFAPFGAGGLKWTRTTDLPLIRRVL